MDDFKDLFEEYSEEYQPFFQAGWSDWEEYALIIIFFRDGKFYLFEDGYSVISSCFSSRCSTIFTEAIDEITEDEALQIMEDWQEYEVI